MKLNKIALALLMAQAVMAAPAVYGQGNTTDGETTQATPQRTEYSFRQKNTPVKIAPYNTVVFSMTPTEILTMRGDELYSTKDNMLTLSVIPTGVSYGVIQQNKKGGKEAIFLSTSEHAKKIGHVDIKKYGVPAALAYSPDARKIYVATDKGLQVFEPKKMTLVDTMELPFVPSEMAVSDNGYYLTLSDADRVAVINIEQKKVRRNWNYGVKVTDMTFSDDSSQFAVLTEDGILSVYDTRTFNIKNTIDDLGEGIACAFNPDGKYIFVATSPDSLEVINLVRPSDRNTIPVETGSISDMTFIKDSNGNSLLVYTGEKSVKARRIRNLEPHFSKLISDEVDQMMAEWQKMMPGESMEDYRARVNDETRAHQRRLFEDEISTKLAGDLLASATMSLGSYDRTNQVLALDFSTMPTIYLPVPENDVTNFKSAGDLVLSDVQYGVLPDDTFEIVYAKVTNKADGKTYEYNNHDRVAMDFMGGDSNIVSLEILQQQQMEELKLQELRTKVVEEAKSASTISNHTNISVDSRVVPDFDAEGNKILNYEVNFTYQVEPEFSAAEDFPPGKYTVQESGAANAMMKIVKEAFEGDFAQYLKPGKKMKVVISGTADGSPIVRTIPYTGVYGDFEDEPIYENGDLTAITVTKAGGIKENRQLAFLRAMGVKNFLTTNVDKLNEMKADYTVKVDVAEGKGAEFRRITASFTLIDVF